tara:strand:+ start:693 stop:1334 length:642 start_codon:yes stop_codon:yes gene_type:complete
MENKYEIADFFKGYAAGAHSSKKSRWLASPESWLETHVLPYIHLNIKTIVDFGCANGRNFQPFKDYECIGFDMFQPEEINYSCDFKYYVSSIEDFIKNPDLYPIQWESSLVMSHGTLMYCLNSTLQNQFLEILRDKGCKNFVLHEYASDKLIKNGNLSERARNNGLGFLELNKLNLELFKPPLGEKIILRMNKEDIKNDFQAHICLENKAVWE